MLSTLFVLLTQCTLVAAPQDTSADAPLAIVVRPVAFAPALEDWKKFRQSQGFRIVEIDTASEPEDLKKTVHQELKASTTKRKFVVLAGDTITTPINAPKVDKSNSIPTFYLRSEVVKKFGSEPTIGSDLPYSDLDDDNIPDVAIGRIPADSAEQLGEYLRRVVEYERSEDFGEWRHKINVVAGVGGFGPLADGAIEAVTRRLLTEGIPNQFTLGMCYASPTSVYCPNPFDFQKKLLDRLNQGSLFWIYIGHGHVATLDRFQVDRNEFDLLNTQSLDQVSIEQGPPIAVFLACYTGAFDAYQDCLAEKIVMLPKGPIAAIAGTRMTMPYGMSALASQMLDLCFKDHTSTLGELLLEAKRRMVREEESPKSLKPLTALASALSPEGHDLAQERLEHLRLMHILGDPTLNLFHPTTFDITAPSRASPGDTIEIQGQGPQDATHARIELTYRRDYLPPNVRSRSRYQGDEASLQSMNETHEAANDLVLQSLEVPCPQGKIQASLTLPSDAKGRFVARAYLTCPHGVASGSATIQVK